MKSILPALIFLSIVTFCSDLHAQSGRTLNKKADSLFAAGKNKEAIDIYNSAMGYYQNDKVGLSQIYDMRARCERNLRKYKEAINDDSYAFLLNPKNADCIWNRAILYTYNGDYQLAVDDYTHVMTLLKDNKKNLASLYGYRGYDKLKLKHYVEAIEDCDTAITLGLENGFVYSARALANTDNGDFELGINDYLKAMSYYKGDNERLAALYVSCANNSYILKDYQKVIGNCTTAISLNPNSYNSYYYMGKVYLKKLKKNELALEDFKKVIQMDTSKSSIDYIFSLFYSGNPSDAYNKLNERMLKTTSNSDLLSVYYNMACLLSLMNKTESANIYLRKAIQAGYSKKFALYDDDLDNIRNTGDFKEIMAEGASKEK